MSWPLLFFGFRLVIIVNFEILRLSFWLINFFRVFHLNGMDGLLSLLMHLYFQFFHEC